MQFLFAKRAMIGLFRSDVALLTIATGSSQLLSLALLPYLTTVYSPDEFGIYASILAGITLLSAPLLLRLDAVLQIAPDTENQSVIHAAFVVGGCLTCIAAVLGFFIIPFLVDKTVSLNHIILISIFIPTGALCTAIYNLGRQYLAKKRKFALIATSQFLRTATVLVVQCIPLVCLLGAFGLASGFFAGLVLACWILWSSLSAHGIFCLGIKGNFVNVQSVLIKYRAFITFDVINIIISAVALTSFPLLILWQFGKHEAGMYSLASRLVFLPLEIFSGAIATVFFQRVSEAIRLRASVLTTILQNPVGFSRNSINNFFLHSFSRARAYKSISFGELASCERNSCLAYSHFSYKVCSWFVSEYGARTETAAVTERVEHLPSPCYLSLFVPNV